MLHHRYYKTYIGSIKTKFIWSTAYLIFLGYNFNSICVGVFTKGRKQKAQVFQIFKYFNFFNRYIRTGSKSFTSVVG